MYQNLETLSLQGDIISRCVALGELLRKPGCKLKELNLDDNPIDDEGILVLDNAVGPSSLKKLVLSRISSRHTITAALQNPQSAMD